MFKINAEMSILWLHSTISIAIATVFYASCTRFFLRSV
ncbi:hypothetical protein CKA32_004884 [Geitlerinema sp. FC II]|nr:hypothetical protein CKA32_004884 [Geitlerinema sp. FC II]